MPAIIEAYKIEAKPLPEKIFNTESVGISRKTHEEHFKLYQGYVNKTNEIREKLAGLEIDPAKANQTFSDIRELKVEYTFALGGVTNHELYFNLLGGNGGQPSGDVASLINKYWGSFDNWAKDLKATGIAARGWVWLALNHDDGSLFNYIGDAQNTFPVWNTTPILALDTYEHAYYLDFQTARAKYIDAFLEVIDWDTVNANLDKTLRK
ncbi:MAG: superoxide dismutase [bacterium]|jgi:Fe-Mn family superoxide dismutase